MTSTHPIGRRTVALLAVAALTCGGLCAGTAYAGTAHAGTAYAGTAHAGTAHARTAHAGTAAANPPRTDTLTATVSPRPVTRPLPQGFVGLAFTYSALARWVSESGPVDPVLVRLIRNLTPVGRPWLRIGGESADRSWWPIPGYRKPIGITYDLGPAWTEIARRFARATNARLMLGLELEADRPAIDRVEARQLLRRVGSRYIQSFQIGNEPELYRSIPWYKTHDGHPVLWYSPVGTPVFARPHSYGASQFIAEISRILRVIPRYPVAGPETNIPSWTQAFVRYLKPAGVVNTLTAHAYAVDNCIKDPHSNAYPTVRNLLTLRASRNLLRGLAPYISLAHARGGTYRIDELGAVTCTGPAGVSDSMATALWAVDALFDAARQGVDGVNLHTNYARVNNLFSLGFADGGWRATVQPLYYGALMFERADPAGSRLLTVQGGTSDALRVWATRRGHTVRIALVDDSLRGGGTVHLRVAKALSSRSATLQRLVASDTRGAYATHGVALGGRSFGTTTTGALRAPRLTTIKRRGGAFTVAMPKGSAALLTIDTR